MTQPRGMQLHGWPGGEKLFYSKDSGALSPSLWALRGEGQEMDSGFVSPWNLCINTSLEFLRVAQLLELSMPAAELSHQPWPLISAAAKENSHVSLFMGQPWPFPSCPRVGCSMVISSWRGLLHILPHPAVVGVENVSCCHRAMSDDEVEMGPTLIFFVIGIPVPAQNLTC